MPLSDWGLVLSSTEEFEVPGSSVICISDPKATPKGSSPSWTPANGLDLEGEGAALELSPLCESMEPLIFGSTGLRPGRRCWPLLMGNPGGSCRLPKCLYMSLSSRSRLSLFSDSSVSKERADVCARELRPRKDGRWEACRGGLLPHTSSPASGRELL